MRNCASEVWSSGPSRNDGHGRGRSLTDVASVAVGSKARISVFNRGVYPVLTRHSPLRPDALMIGHQRSISAFWNARRASGDC